MFHIVFLGRLRTHSYSQARYEFMTSNRPTISTFGCRLNIWESELIRQYATDASLNNTVIFNTCAVTSEAEKQARQAIRKTKREQPEKQIIVTGCAAQINPEKWLQMTEVDHVIGNHEKLLEDSWQRLKNTELLPMEVSDISEIRETAAHMIDSFEEHTRGFLQIQQGCNHRCSFCIIPYGRGQSRSVAAGQVVESVRTLCANGTKEVVLSGIDLTSWGQDLPGSPKLGWLVLQVLKEVPELPRLRLSSIDPAEFDHFLMTAFEAEPRLMPHVHLSVQHGDDIILKRMKRRHLARDVVRLSKELRKRRPDILLGADLIAGFPTETEQAHKATLALIEQAELSHLHVFSYSDREGTPAVKMPKTDHADIRRRASELRDAGRKQYQKVVLCHVNKPDEILLEKSNQGYLRNFIRVNVSHDELLPSGHIHKVKITHTDLNSKNTPSVIAELVE